MPFSQEVKTKAMVACARRCCICHNYCGSKMEVHHIKAQSCGGSFPLGYFDRIEFFPQLINDPKYEYMDKDIDQLKNELALCIIEFTNNCFPYLHCDDGKNVRIPPDMLMTNMEKYIDASELLNKLSLNIWNKYSDYIKLCKRKLKVNVK